MAKISIELLEAEDYACIPYALRQGCYGEIVEKLVRKRYSQSKVEAILNNYLEDPTNEEHKREFMELQAYRKECKALARSILAIDEI